MSQKLSISRKDGTKLNLNGDGNVWLLLDKSGGPNIGTIHNGVCSVYWIHGLNEKTQKHYLPVDRLLMKYADKLGIEKIRLEYTYRRMTDTGWRLIVRYAYIAKDKFEYLLSHRKEKKIGDVRKVVLLKKNDFTYERI